MWTPTSLSSRTNTSRRVCRRRVGWEEDSTVARASAVRTLLLAGGVILTTRPPSELIRPADRGPVRQGPRPPHSASLCPESGLSPVLGRLLKDADELPDGPERRPGAVPGLPVSGGQGLGLRPPPQSRTSLGSQDAPPLFMLGRGGDRDVLLTPCRAGSPPPPPPLPLLLMSVCLSR